MIHYKESLIPQKEQLYHLYKDVGWTNYTNRIENLVKGYENSDVVITAWNEEQLVGAIRCITDFETIFYVQDLLVLSAFQHQGVGITLLKKAKEIGQDIPQFLLLTENNEKTNSFYRKMGLVPVGDTEAISFIRVD